MRQLFILLLTLFSTTAYAVSPTPTDQNNQVNQEDIEKIRQAVQQKVKEKLAQISTPATGKKAFIGTISKIEGSTLNLEYQDQNWTLLVDDQTVYIDQKRNKTELEEISSGQAILAMGQLNQDQVLETKRIVLVDPESLEARRQIQLGQIADISQSSVFMLIPLANKDIQYQIKTDAKTSLLTPQNKKLNLSDLANGQKVIAVFTPTKANSKTYLALKIVVLSTPTPTPTE